MISSPTEIPGPGAPYEDVVPLFPIKEKFGNVMTAGILFVQKIVELLYDLFLIINHF